MTCTKGESSPLTLKGQFVQKGIARAVSENAGAAVTVPYTKSSEIRTDHIATAPSHKGPGSGSLKRSNR
jgi:hypothetical protein